METGNLLRSVIEIFVWSTWNHRISAPPRVSGPCHCDRKVLQQVILFHPQDSSSVIQFMTHAKVKVDPSLRVVEVASGNPEEMTVSTTPTSTAPH